MEWPVMKHWVTIKHLTPLESLIPVSPRAALQARDPETRPPNSPDAGVLGEINSTSSTSSLCNSCFFLSSPRDCCLYRYGVVQSDSQINFFEAMMKGAVLWMRTWKWETYRSIECVNRMKQPRLLNLCASGKDLWVFTGVPPRHIHNLVLRERQDVGEFLPPADFIQEGFIARVLTRVTV